MTGAANLGIARISADDSNERTAMQIRCLLILTNTSILF